MAPLEVGEVVEGRYKIVRPIAAGGGGSIYLAEHWLIKRRVALKVLHGEFAQDATMIRRFMNEAVAAGTLGHPNIIESTDMGFTKTDLPYIVFEYLDGTPLSKEIDQRGPLSVPRALKIAYQIASALEAAHEGGIIHRDLKTDNIFLAANRSSPDHVKVIDFGISRFETSDRTAVGSQSLVGTPEFMAPEQVLAPEAVDKRVDIYGLGMVLYEMLAGKLPFRLHQTGEHPSIDEAHALLERVLTEMPPLVVHPEAPPGLPELINERLIAKDPAHRFQSMKDVQAALEAFATIVPTGRVTVTFREEPKHDRKVAAIGDQTVSRQEIDPSEASREVKALGKRWSLAGDVLHVDIYHREMAKLARIVEQAAALGDEMDHLPRIEIEPPHMRLSIPDATTVVALVLAARLEQWLREQGL